jgi:hypothetical protein
LKPVQYCSTSKIAAIENGIKESALQAILFLMTTMMSHGLFICETLILSITAVNKNQVPYAMHPDPHPAARAGANMQ